MTAFGAKTYFSKGESIIRPKDLIERAEANGQQVIAVADTNSVNAIPQLVKAAKGTDIQIVAGATLNVVDNLGYRKEKGVKSVNPSFQPSIYAKNKDGFKDIMKLLTLSFDEDHFYFIPQISWEEVVETLGRGNTVLTTGGMVSLFAHRDWQSKLVCDDVKELLSAHPEAIVCEGIAADTPYFNRVTNIAAGAAETYNLPMMFSRPALFKVGDEHARMALNCIVDMGKTKVTDMWRREPSKDLHIQPPKNYIRHIEEAIERCENGCTSNEKLSGSLSYTLSLPDVLAYRWEPWDISLPQMAENPFAELVKLSKEGWRKRIENPTLAYLPSKADLPVYHERLKYELGILKKMGFENYFLLVRQLVVWSKESDIYVGPARGSAAGSLVAFLIGITDIDPIRFGLIFERFINPSRLDLPDIDLDFMSTRRQEVVAFLSKTYGQAQVAGIANYVMLGGRSAVRATGSAHGLKDDDYSCSKLIPEDGNLVDAMESTAEVEKYAVEHPRAFEDAVKLEGVLRNYGQHAAGVVVGGEPLNERAVIERRKGEYVINWDKRFSEDFGLVKLDVLGLSTLDILKHASDYVKERTGSPVDYNMISLDDPLVMKNFSEARTIAIFQFDGGGMRGLLKKLAEAGPLDFDKITATTALFRPGPLEAGLTEKYISINRGDEYEDYPHPATEEALRETRSVIVYQEQVMKIAVDLAGFSMAEADGLRKAMGKKDPVEMAKFKDKWIEGCVNHSEMPPRSAEILFDQVEKFAGYGFNKSHAVAYTVLSYWAMYLKTHHTTEFFAAALTVLSEDKRLAIVTDAEKHGITIMPPDINVSTHRFEIGKTPDGGPALYAPWQLVKGLSEKGTAAILKAREIAGGRFESTEEFLATVEKRACNSAVREKLSKVGVFFSIDAEDKVPPRHPDRLKDQKQFLPGLMSIALKADRFVDIAPYVKTGLADIRARCVECGGCSLAGQPHPQPRLGRKPRFVIVTDSPSFYEGQKNKMGEGQSMDSLHKALDAAGLKLQDCYITSLIKGVRGKGVDVTNEMINGCSSFLDEELKLLNAPVIVPMGKHALRHLLPDEKGKWEEMIEKDFYDPKRDCTILPGFNMGMIFFDPNKQTLLNDIMKKVASLTME